MSFKPFENRVIAITGAASGLGLATAHLLAERGAMLSLADLSKEALQEVAKSIREKTETEVMVFALDVRNYSQVSKWILETRKRFGRLDGAANMAGVAPPSLGLKTIPEQDFEEWDFVMGVNMTGVMHCLRAQLDELSDDGSIVNASSIAGLVGRPKNAAYCASKHAVLGLSRSAAKEYGYKGIRVNAICPGRIETPMTASLDESFAKSGGNQPTGSSVESMVALKRTGQPEEVAKLISFLLSDESSYITGQAISIDGGWI